MNLQSKRTLPVIYKTGAIQSSINNFLNFTCKGYATKRNKWHMHGARVINTLAYPSVDLLDEDEFTDFIVNWKTWVERAKHSNAIQCGRIGHVASKGYYFRIVHIQLYC